MRSVSRFESHLLRIVYCLLGQAPRAEALPLILREIARPPGLSRDAVELVQAALAKGCVRLLARGGWRRERFLRQDEPVVGRLWQRTPPSELAFTFSRNALDFLIWLTACNPVASERTWKPNAQQPLTTGDRFLLFLAYRAVRGTEIAVQLRRRQTFAGSALCWLAYPEDFADVQSGVRLDCETWTAGAGAAVLEAWQHELADLWVCLERSKAEITQPDRMRAVGRVQQRVLHEFCDALERVARRDLARFLVQATQRLLRDRPSAEAWLARLNVDRLSMAQRAETYEGAFAFLRALERLQGWERQARMVGYFDEGYAAAQLWKADWERWDGELGCEWARTIVRQADPLHVASDEQGVNS